MTVTYTHEVADCRGFGNFWRLLFRWKGSVYKLIWPDLLAYTFFYYGCSAVYRFALDEDSKRIFEKVSRYCAFYGDLIPVSFVLGFYVSIVIQRWWAQYQTLPWPDSLALFISTSISGHDNRGRLMRRTIMRYINLAYTITLTMITPRVKKRFPTIDHLVEAGFMTPNEKKIFQGISERTPHSVHFVPLVWAGSIVARARKENRIRDDFAVKTIIDEINNIRGKCGGLLSYDWISIPLVYTQVVTLAVYSFFLATIMGRQFLDPKMNYPHHDIDFYFPIFNFLQFFFYMGWLKVAESLVNPFGEDDDDFEVNWLVDRNFTISYMIVDEMHNEHPELIQDLYWDEVFPQELPYTVASEQYRRDPPMGSTANICISEADQEFLPVLDEEDEDEDQDPEKGTPSSFKKVASQRSIESNLNSGRKNSVISFFQNRLMPRSFGGSNTSIHRSRPRLNRSASKTSERSSVKRNNTNASLQGSEVFRMSEESLINPGKASPRAIPASRDREGKNSPFYNRMRTTSENDDEPILIKIKRRDAEDKDLAVNDSNEEMAKKLEIIEDDDESTETTPLTKDKAPQVVRFKKLSTASGFNVSMDKSSMNKSPSQCSIQTSIFFDGSGNNDVNDEKEDKEESEKEKGKESEKEQEKNEKPRDELLPPVATRTNSLTRRIKSDDPETDI